MDALACTSMYFEQNSPYPSDSCSNGSKGTSDCDMPAGAIESELTITAGFDYCQPKNKLFQFERCVEYKGTAKRGKDQSPIRKRRKDFHSGLKRPISEPHREDESKDSGYTPLQRQFLALKSKHPDVVLMIETGYLYRLFDSDADIARKELQFKTKFRHNMLTTSLPCQTLHIHISRLAAKGYKVGVVRKTETAFMKAAGEERHCIFKRELVAVYTKSTLIGEEVDPVTTCDSNHRVQSQIHSSTYLLCLYEIPGNHSTNEVRIGIMAVCPLSGDMIYDCFIDDDQRQALQSLLANVRPVEILIPETQLSDETERVIAASAQGDIFGEEVRLERMQDRYFKFDQSKVCLQEFFDSTKSCSDDEDNLLIYVTGFPPPVVCCMGAILAYLKEFKLEDVLILVKNMKKYCPTHNCMYMDVDTMKMLGLFQYNATLSQDGSLFGLIDKTSTAFGSRLLRTWLSQPLTNIIEIRQRLDAVEEIRNKAPLVISSVQALLSKMPDLESGITSIFYKKCSTKKYWKTISSLIHIKNFIESMQDSIQSLECNYVQGLFLSVENSLQGVESLRNNLDCEAAWNGYKHRLFKEHQQHPNLLAATKDIEATRKRLDDLLPDIASLLGRTNIQYSQFSEKEYVIIVKSSCAAIIPSDWIIVAQTSKKICCRTAEMDSLAKKMKLLQEHFKYECHLAWLEYLETFKCFYHHFRSGILNLAKLDCLIALATLAKLENYERPQLVSSAEACIHIEDGRHPMLDQMLVSDKQYIPNDIFLTQSSTSSIVISGANMGGKSTYVRGVALTIILCQIGSFVPARAALISPLEAIYARSGVRDDIMRGKSSFCVEAGKVAEIFQHLPRMSLVLLDEFGRCTSDTDGIALAYGALRHLVTKVGCFCLVVTQFPEIAKLGTEFPRLVKNCHVTILVDSDIGGICGTPEITYLYKLAEGVGERGYSIKACSMAGIEESILAVAASKSQEMEDAKERRRLAERLFRKVHSESGLALADGIRLVKDLWLHS